MAKQAQAKKEPHPRLKGKGASPLSESWKAELAKRKAPAAQKSSAAAKKPVAKARAASPSAGSLLPLGQRPGNPGSKADWKKRRAAIDKASDGR